MEKTATDIEILEHVAGGRMIKDMSALEFIGWLAEKLNGLTVNPIVNELRMAVASPPMMGSMAMESKILFVRKLLEVNQNI
jgi:hypothetical protein